MWPVIQQQREEEWTDEWSDSTHKSPPLSQLFLFFLIPIIIKDGKLNKSQNLKYVLNMWMVHTRHINEHTTRFIHSLSR